MSKVYAVSYWGNKAEIALMLRGRPPISFKYGETKAVELSDQEKNIGGHFKIRAIEAGAPEKAKPEAVVLKGRSRKGVSK